MNIRRLEEPRCVNDNYHPLVILPNGDVINVLKLICVSGVSYMNNMAGHMIELTLEGGSCIPIEFKSENGFNSTESLAGITRSELCKIWGEMIVKYSKI